MSLPLLPNQCQEYSQKGWTVVRDLFSSIEVHAIQQETDRLWSQPALFQIETGFVPRENQQSGAIVRDRLDPVICHSELFSDLARDERVVRTASTLIGDAALLYKDKLIVKPPQATGYSVHQDLPYFDFFKIPANNLTIVLIAIDEFTPENGALELFSGLHHQQLPSPPEEPRDVDESCLVGATSCTPKLNAGDVIVFHTLTPHRSRPNLTNHSRRSLFLTYSAAAFGNCYDKYQRRRYQAVPTD